MSPPEERQWIEIKQPGKAPSATGQGESSTFLSSNNPNEFEKIALPFNVGYTAWY